MASRKLETGKDKLTKTPLTSPDRSARGKKNIITAKTRFSLENNNVSSNAKPNTKKIPGNARKATCLPEHKTLITSLKPMTSKVNVRNSISSLSYATNKATSTTNDVIWGLKPLHETTKELIRRDRERKKLRRFELKIKRLRGLQSDFMQTCAELKDVNPSFITKQYKFIGVELNDKFQLLVNENDLLRFPKNLPSETINDLKKNVKFCLHRCRVDLIDHLKVIQNTKEISDFHPFFDYIHKRLPKLFNSQLDECMKQIDCLCKDPKNRKDTELTRTLCDLQDSRRCCQKLERELNDIKKRNAEEKCLLISDHKTTIKNANKARENHEKKLNKRIWELKNQLTAQAATLKDSLNESKQRDIKPLHKDTIKLDSSSNQICYELDKAKNQLNSYKQNKEKYCETINSLEKQLEQAREQINKLQNFELEEKNQEINELQNVITHLKEENETLKEKDKLTINRKEPYDKIEQLKVQASNEEMSETISKSKSIPKSIILETLQNFETEELKNKLLESEKEIEDLKEELTLNQMLLDERSHKLNEHIISKKENQEKMDFLTYKDIEKSTIIEQLNSKILFYKEQMNAFDFQLRDKEMKLIWQIEAFEKLEARIERRNQEIKRLKELNKKSRNDDQDDIKVVYKKKHYKSETE